MAMETGEFRRRTRCASSRFRQRLFSRTRREFDCLSNVPERNVFFRAGSHLQNEQVVYGPLPLVSIIDDGETSLHSTKPTDTTHTSPHQPSNFGEASLDGSFLSPGKLLVPSEAQVPSFLHYYTKTETDRFCRNLLHLFRKANLCKAHSSSLLQLIDSALPQPNNLPTSLSAMLQSVSGKRLFF
jgi:hypothetical protein